MSEFTIEQEKIFDACVEALRSGAAHKECVIPSEIGIGEKFLSRFQWADWMTHNKNEIIKSANGGDL